MKDFLVVFVIFVVIALTSAKELDLSALTDALKSDSGLLKIVVGVVALAVSLVAAVIALLS